MAIYLVVLGTNIKLGVDESKWVDFGAIFEGEMDVCELQLREAYNVLYREEVLSLSSGRCFCTSGYCWRSDRRWWSS